MKNQDGKARDRILTFAGKVFAEKGYDGTSVDEIASGAEVSKSLIYYHFKGKDKILDALMEEFQDEVTNFIKTSLESDEFQTSRKDFKEYIEHFIRFFEGKKNLFRILFMESFKENPGNPQIFEIAGFFISEEIKKIYRKKFTHKGTLDSAQREEAYWRYMVFEFFTGLIPIMAFSVYQDKMSQFLGAPAEHLRELFISSFSDTHLAAHLKYREQGLK